MRVALLGLQGSGKTTVFNAVAENPVESLAGVPQTVHDYIPFFIVVGWNGS